MADTRTFGSGKEGKKKKGTRTTQQSPSAPPPVAAGAGDSGTGDPAELGRQAEEAPPPSAVPDPVQAAYRSGRRKAPSTGPVVSSDTRATLMDARPTLLMNPSHVEAQVARTKTLTPGSHIAPVTGTQAPETSKAVVVQGHSYAIEAADGSLQHAPEIELIEHEVPDDAPPDPRLVLVDDADSEQAAAYRVLRHHLLELGHPQVVAVSGPHERCGKTTVAVNLALALSECDRANVLLVDANLRRPALASILRFIPPWCFAEQLAQHREQPLLPWGFVDIPKLWLHVAAVNPRSDRKHRLDAPAFAIAMDRLRLADYDHIVIDCPPVLGTADVNLIQDSADGVILVGQTRKMTTRDIQDCAEQLTPTRILGSVLLET